MKKIISIFLLLTFLFSFSSLAFSKKGGYVKAYYRKNGTHTNPYYRSSSYSNPKTKKTYKPKIPYNIYSKKKVLTNSKIKVIDGDTFYYNGNKYRINGIDTPEKGQYNYEKAKNRLKSLLENGNIEIEEVAKDKYGRTVAKVRVNGEDVADILKREGLQKSK